jgi:hypothetical protein
VDVYKISYQIVDWRLNHVSDSNNKLQLNKYIVIVHSSPNDESPTWKRLNDQTFQVYKVLLPLEIEWMQPIPSLYIH